MLAQLKLTTLTIDGQFCTLSKLKDEHVSRLPSGGQVKIERPDQAQILLDSCNQLEAFLMDVRTPKGAYRKMQNLLFRRVLGHLSYVCTNSKTA